MRLFLLLPGAPSSCRPPTPAQSWCSAASLAPSAGFGAGCVSRFDLRTHARRSLRREAAVRSTSVIRCVAPATGSIENKLVVELHPSADLTVLYREQSFMDRPAGNDAFPGIAASGSRGDQVRFSVGVTSSNKFSRNVSGRRAARSARSASLSAFGGAIRFASTLASSLTRRLRLACRDGFVSATTALSAAMTGKNRACAVAVPDMEKTANATTAAPIYCAI